MKLFSIKSGKAEIIASGTVRSFNNNPLKFQIGEEDSSLNIILDFRNEKENEDIHSDLEKIDEYTLKMILYNFNSPMGAGSKKPMPLGYINNKRLYIHLNVSTLEENTDKIVQYNFYLVDEGVDNHA